MSSVHCKTCNKEFHVRPSHILMGWGKYCSRACHHKGMQIGKIVNCLICGKEVYKSPTELNKVQSKKYFCSKSCQTKWRNRQYIGPKHLNWKDGRSAYRSVMSRHNIKQICFYCRNTDKRILAVHHIDENHLNNDIKNLAWMCHNCHHLVHNDKVEKQKFLVSISKK